jgi:hypothetical protein
MEPVATQLNNPWLAFIFMSLGGLLTLIIKSSVSKYAETRAKHVAEGVNLPEQLDRTFLDQSAKSSAARLDMAKAEHAMKILGLMSEIESLLFNWKLTAFFHSDELQEGQTVEDLGIKDLKKVSQINMELLKTANEASVLLGDHILVLVSEWSSKINPILYDYYSAYTVSKNMHKNKPAMDSDRVTTITEITRSEIYKSMEPIGELKRNIKEHIKHVANFS